MQLDTVAIVTFIILFSVLFGACSSSFNDFPIEIQPAAAEVPDDQKDRSAIALVRQYAHPVTGAPRDYDPLLSMIGDNRFVMLGEATHGTHEFYHERLKITRRLIEEKGFDAIVLEANWTDAFEINQYVLGKTKHKNATLALAGFTRFPVWMWRNAEFRDLVESVRSINDSRTRGEHKVGVYGMDLYGIKESAAALVDYLRRTDQRSADQAARRYECINRYRRIEDYAMAVRYDPKASCEKQVTEQFQETENVYRIWLKRGNGQRNDELFAAYQNARVVKNAEIYYRRSLDRGFSSWNLRDTHMSETINALADYFDAVGDGTSKIVVWAHNSHQGDALMTDMGESGEFNVGHLMRKAHDGKTVLVGFTTDRGKVMAAREWDQPGEIRTLQPALPGSYARIFADTGIPNFLLTFRGNERLSKELSSERLQRAVGVIYVPETELQSHYFQARISQQFDAVVHLSETKAVEPLGLSASPRADE